MAQDAIFLAKMQKQVDNMVANINKVIDVYDMEATPIIEPVTISYVTPPVTEG